MYYTPEVWCFIFRRDSSRYLHVLRQSFRGPLAFLVDVTSRRQFACVAIPGWVVPMGFANLDEVRPLRPLSPSPAYNLSSKLAFRISFGSGSASRNTERHSITAGGLSTTRSNMPHPFPSSTSQQLSASSYPILRSKKAARSVVNHGMVNINSSASGTSHH